MPFMLYRGYTADDQNIYRVIGDKQTFSDLIDARTEATELTVTTVGWFDGRLIEKDALIEPAIEYVIFRRMRNGNLNLGKFDSLQAALDDYSNHISPKLSLPYITRVDIAHALYEQSKKRA